MRWLNKYHKGFNRLWFVITCIPVIIALIYSQLGDEYKTDRYVADRDNWFKENSEQTIGEWVQEKWRENQTADNPVDKFRFARRWYPKVKSLRAAKDFTDNELVSIISRAIESEQTYAERSWANRLYALQYFAITLGVCIAIFVFGHGVFLVVWWIIRGFR